MVLRRGHNIGFHGDMEKVSNALPIWVSLFVSLDLTAFEDGAASANERM